MDKDTSGAVAAIYPIPAVAGTPYTLTVSACSANDNTTYTYTLGSAIPFGEFVQTTVAE